MSFMKSFDIFRCPLIISAVSLKCFRPVSMPSDCHSASLMIQRCQILIRGLWATEHVSAGVGKLSKASSYSRKEKI